MILRAASGALAVAASLVPMDADVWTELGAMRQNARDGEGAREAFEQVIALRPNSGRAHFDLSGVSPTPELHLRRALELDPQLSLAYSSLARVLSRASRHAEAEDALRGLVHVDPTAGAKRLYDHLFFGMRKAEAAVSYKMAIHARNRSILETDSLAVEWKEYVDDLVARAPTAQPKCLERRCIQGLEDALKQAAGGPQAVTVHPPHTAASVDHMILRVSLIVSFVVWDGRHGGRGARKSSQSDVWCNLYADDYSFIKCGPRNTVMPL